MAGLKKSRICSILLKRGTRLGLEDNWRRQKQRIRLHDGGKRAMPKEKSKRRNRINRVQMNGRRGGKRSGRGKADQKRAERLARDKRGGCGELREEEEGEDKGEAAGRRKASQAKIKGKEEGRQRQRNGTKRPARKRRRLARARASRGSRQGKRKDEESRGSGEVKAEPGKPSERAQTKERGRARRGGWRRRAAEAAKEGKQRNSWERYKKQSAGRRHGSEEEAGEEAKAGQ